MDEEDLCMALYLGQGHSCFKGESVELCKNSAAPLALPAKKANSHMRAAESQESSQDRELVFLLIFLVLNCVFFLFGVGWFGFRFCVWGREECLM